MIDLRIRVLINNMKQDNDDLQRSFEMFEEDITHAVEEYLSDERGIPKKLVKIFMKRSKIVKRVILATIEDAYSE